MKLPEGFVAWGGHCGIKEKAPDFAILSCPDAVGSAALFTTCRVCAPSIEVGRAQRGSLKAFVINSGNANACTGDVGLRDVLNTRSYAAAQLGLSEREVLVSSTGKIGTPLPMEAIFNGIEKGVPKLSAGSFINFAKAIKTTDLVHKLATREITIGRKKVLLSGASKGSGMIEPNMATMLAYIATDADISSALLQRCLKKAVARSFNSISVDGHMSTNDTCAIMASGRSAAITKKNIAAFQEALDSLCLELAQKIIWDGEGATKFVTVEISGACNQTEARAMARAIGNSPLVKTAIHGEDPNWGRIVSAAGYSSQSFEPQKAQLQLNGVTVFEKGVPVIENIPAAEKAVKAKELHILLRCNSGRAQGLLYTCDLSREYIAINADYHT